MWNVMRAGRTWNRHTSRYRELNRMWLIIACDFVNIKNNRDCIAGNPRNSGHAYGACSVFAGKVQVSGCIS